MDFFSQSKNNKLPGFLCLRGVSQHNLQNIDLDIPHNRFIVITGVSGSGKSSLAFDTICKESERRYLESFSSYARQFLGKLKRPELREVSGLTPVIAVDQETLIRNSRSTVGTITTIYDLLRLLYARFGVVPPETAAQGPIDRSLFSYNSPQGACPQCKGLGIEDKIDPQLLIGDPHKTLRQGALSITTPSGYIIYSQVTMEVLDKVCRAHGFHVDIPWYDLTPEQQYIVLYGSDIIKIPYGKHPLESRMKWTGITAKPREEGYYKGILPVMENILRQDRNANILRFVRSTQCTHCSGSRLSSRALSVMFRGKNIAEMSRLSIHGLNLFFETLELSISETPIETIRQEILKRSRDLIQLGLGYISLDRESTTLSGGEARRLRLASQLGSGLNGITYILDEPTAGLHPSETGKLIEILRRLRDEGNTIIVVEHDEDMIRSADWIIEIGPGAGINGGHVLFNGTFSRFLESPTPPDKNSPLRLGESRTRAFLTGEEKIPTHPQRIGNGNTLSIRGARAHNLKEIDVSFHLGALNTVTGVSGAGKSTLVHDILANALRKHFYGARTESGVHAGLYGIEFIDKIIEIDQSPIGRTPRSNPATYTGLFDPIRDLFAIEPLSIERKWDKGRFSFNVKGGRCEACEGAGVLRIGMHFMGEVDTPCEECAGKRFNPETLEVRYKGKNIYDVLEMPIAEAFEFFKDHPGIIRYLKPLTELGLGYITLGQPATTLSGGEAQRVKLATELAKPATGKTLYIFDEPTTGLHTADIAILLESIHRLVDKGNTVIAVEHYREFIAASDWIIVLGPGSGDEGGNLVFAGLPQEMATFKTISKESQDLSILPAQTTLNSSLSLSEESYNPGFIELSQVSTHNLKHIHARFPVNQLTVITGVSGSGKSSFAFDTLYAESRQRYLSGFSTYARRLIPSLSGARMESCSNLTPAIAISQEMNTRNPRSTVGTMTEIYTLFRLLYARIGKREDNHSILESLAEQDKHETPDILSRLFSFNHIQGACTQCSGLGTVTRCDWEKLVTQPDSSLIDGAMNGTKTGKFYGDPYGQYVAILQAVGKKIGIDFSKPWNNLDSEQRRVAMMGTGDTIYDVTWKFKRKNREGEHAFRSEWKGFANLVDDEYTRKHADRRGDAMLPLMSLLPCPQCGGTRLNNTALSFSILGKNIAQLCAETIENNIAFFQYLESSALKDEENNPTRSISKYDLEITSEIRKEIIKRLIHLKDVGVGYLFLDRDASTLSGGESRRIRLASQLGSGLSNVTYVLDEPTIGLHPSDTRKLVSMIKELRDIGNTVIVVEHDADVIREADYIIDMGPVGGREGGYIVSSGTLSQIIADKNSLTGSYLKNPDLITVSSLKRKLKPGIKINGAYAHGLKQIDIEIPSGGMIVVTGVSGAGKSTLVYDILAASARDKRPVGCQSIQGLDNFDDIIEITRNPIGASISSTPATYTHIFDFIRDLFSKTPQAVKLGFKKNFFSFNSKGGRCETCQGAGQLKFSMDFLPDEWVVCSDCHGKRYKDEALNCVLNGKTIADVLELTVEEAVAYFSSLKAPAEILRVLHLMVEVGLEYIPLGQPTSNLSGGEAQRLKLVSCLAGGKRKNTLYLLDEPTTGLHFKDVKHLLAMLHRLVNEGNTVLVIEHHPDIIKNADFEVHLVRE